MAIDQHAALRAAQARVAAIEADPLAAAQKQIHDENAVRGAQALVHALVDHVGGGPITLGRDAIQAPDPRKRLSIEPQADGSVIVRFSGRESPSGT